MVKIGNRKKKRWRYLEDYSLVTPMPVIKIKTHEAEVNAQKNMLCSAFGAKMQKPTIIMKDCDTQLYALGLFIRRTKHRWRCKKPRPQNPDGFRLCRVLDHEFTSARWDRWHYAKELVFYLALLYELPVGWLDWLRRKGKHNAGDLCCNHCGIHVVIPFFAINRHLKFIEGQLIHHEHLYHLEKMLQKQMSLNQNDEEKNQPLLDEHHLEVHVDHRPSYKYDIDGNEKLLMEGDENHHHMLFWGGESGIEMMFSYIRVELVMIAVYIGCFVVAVGAGSAPAVHHGRIPRLCISNNSCGGSGARCIAHKRLSRFTTKLCYRYKRRGTNQSQGNQPHVAHYEIKKCNACVTQHELFHAQCRPNGAQDEKWRLRLSLLFPSVKINKERNPWHLRGQATACGQNNSIIWANELELLYSHWWRGWNLRRK